MKKIIIGIMFILLCVCSVSAFAEYESGAYYQLGKYKEKPILWRCVSTNDENGILMVSDKILCFKAANAGENNINSVKEIEIYGENFWEESTIRTWLNSTAAAGTIDWGKYPPDQDHLSTKGHKRYYPYADEAGFLSEDNFTETERSVFKSVYQWIALPSDKLDLSTNGCTNPFITEYHRTKNWGDNEVVGNTEISDFPSAYKGAMYRIKDTVFLLNENQVKSVSDIYGTAGTDSVCEPYEDMHVTKQHKVYGAYYPYLLISPYIRIDEVTNTSYFNAIYYGIQNTQTESIIYPRISNVNTSTELGIRPAFYLNDKVTRIKSGSGTVDDPYVLDGIVHEDITVFSNSEQIEFTQKPYIENSRTLVGMRAIFESLGAEVTWDGQERKVMATKGNTIIQLQIDNPIMLVNEEKVMLDTPARLVNDNTMVPIRAISEALNARVEWIPDLQRVVVDEQPEWIESDWNPDWYQQAMRAGGYIE